MATDMDGLFIDVPSMLDLACAYVSINTINTIKSDYFTQLNSCQIQPALCQVMGKCKHIPQFFERN